MIKVAAYLIVACLFFVGCVNEERSISVSGRVDPSAPIDADWTVHFRSDATSESITEFMSGLSSVDNPAARAMAEAKADYETNTLQVRLDPLATPQEVADLRGAFESSGLVENVDG